MGFGHQRNLTAFLKELVQASQGFLAKGRDGGLCTRSQKIQSSDMSGPPIFGTILAAGKSRRFSHSIEPGNNQAVSLPKRVTLDRAIIALQAEGG